MNEHYRYNVYYNEKKRRRDKFAIIDRLIGANYENILSIPSS